MSQGLPRPKVSIVIPVRDRSEELARCLWALHQQTLPADEYEILVCDDGSSVSCAASMTENRTRVPHVRYFRQPPKGPAAARNLGVRHARADIIAFTDSDTIPCSEWLEQLIAPFRDPNVVAVEGPVRVPEPACSPLLDAPRGEGGAFITANIAYRRQTLIDIGGLDEAFPLAAFEDADLALAARHRGAFAWAPGAVVVHPWRKLTLGGAIRRLKQMDWLLVTALRHGCLGWEGRPTRYPRLRIALAAALTLPLGRARRAVQFLPVAPEDSFVRLGICLIESVVATLSIPRWLLVRPLPRGRYLDGATP